MFLLLAFTAHFTLHIMWLVEFYFDVIARSRLQLINTSIDTSFIKLSAFLIEQQERPMMVKRKLDSGVYESSAD